MGASIRIERDADAVGILTISREQVMNALDLPTLAELERCFGELESDANVRSIIITGAGEKAFVAGGDIADLGSRQGLAHYQEFAETIHRVFRRIELSDKPTVAAINGWALGGGAELLLCTDIRFMAESAKIGLPEINLGLFPGAGGSQRLIRQLSPCRAKEMMFSGQAIAATRALEWGLVNRVVPNAELMREAKSFAAQLAGRSSLAIRLLKRALIQGADMPAAAALAHEQAMIGLVLDSHDAHEGCAAFLEKRPARFEHR